MTVAVLPQLVYQQLSFPWRDPLHPFVQCVIPASDGIVIFRSRAAGALHGLVAAHVVKGRVIFPGAGYLEMARAAGMPGLRGVYFVQPLVAEVSGLLVECAVSTGRFEVRSGEDGSLDDDSMVHCSGAMATDTIWQRIDHASLRTLARAADVRAMYDGFDAAGLQYGPGYRTLLNAWGGISDASARLRGRSTHEGTQVHPADLDDALCMSVAMASSGGGETRLPFAVDDALLEGVPGELWAVCSRSLSSPLKSTRLAPTLTCCSCPSPAGCGASRSRGGLCAARGAFGTIASTARRLHVAGDACAGADATPPVYDRVAPNRGSSRREGGGARDQRRRVDRMRAACAARVA